MQHVPAPTIGLGPGSTQVATAPATAVRGIAVDRGTAGWLRGRSRRWTTARARPPRRAIGGAAGSGARVTPRGAGVAAAAPVGAALSAISPSMTSSDARRNEECPTVDGEV